MRDAKNSATSGVRWRRVRSVKGLASERWIVQVQGAVGVDETVAAQVFIEAMDLIAVACLEEVQDVMDEVVDLDDGV